LGHFLAMLEQDAWNYPLNSWLFPAGACDVFQEIQTYAYWQGLGTQSMGKHAVPCVLLNARSAAPP